MLSIENEGLAAGNSGEDVSLHAQTTTSETTDQATTLQKGDYARFLSVGMQPEHLNFGKALVGGWNYEESIVRVRSLFHSWKLVSEELLWELWWDKYNLTDGFTRTAGRAKNGERTWNTFLTDCFKDNGGPSKRTVDLWIDAFIAAGYTKLERLHGHKAHKQPEQADTLVINDTSDVAAVRTVESTPSQAEDMGQDDSVPMNTSEDLEVIEAVVSHEQPDLASPVPASMKPITVPAEPLVDIIDVERIGDKVWFTIYVPHTDTRYRQVIPA